MYTMIYIIIFGIIVLSMIYHHLRYPEEMRKVNKKKSILDDDTDKKESKYFDYVHSFHSAAIRSAILAILMAEATPFSAIKSISTNSVVNVIMSHYGF
jgi:hypothetical protein